MGLVSWGVLLGGWVTTLPKNGVGGWSTEGVPDSIGASSVPLCLFLHWWGAEGVVCWRVGWGAAWLLMGCAARNWWSKAIVHLWTILAVRLMGVGAFTKGASKFRASTGICKARPWKTVLVESSRTGSSKPCLTLVSPWFLTLPLLSPFDRNPSNWTSR